MADPKSIHEFLAGSADNGSLFLVDEPDANASSGYVTRQVSMTDIGSQVNNGIDYTQDLDTDSKKPIGAINELHDSIGADVYSTNTSYTAGMYCIHNNTLYRCVSPTSGAWDSSKWEAKTITSLIESKADSSDVDNSSVTIARKSGVSSSVYLPTAVRRGHVITILFDGSLIAGSYNSVTNGGTWEIDPKPRAKTTSFVNCDGMKGLAVMPDGTVGFYSNATIGSNSTIVGSITYITGD